MKIKRREELNQDTLCAQLITEHLMGKDTETEGGIHRASSKLPV